MKAERRGGGHIVVLTYEPENGDKLVSPDGQFHFIPCDHCGTPEWKNLNVVSYICELCAAEPAE